MNDKWTKENDVTDISQMLQERCYYYEYGKWKSLLKRMWKTWSILFEQFFNMLCLGKLART